MIKTLRGPVTVKELTDALAQFPPGYTVVFVPGDDDLTYGCVISIVEGNTVDGPGTIDIRPQD